MLADQYFSTAGSPLLTNSQCTLDVAHTAVQDNGNNLALTVPITFAAGFTGQKYVWEKVYDHTGQDTGWLSVGTWNVAQPGANLPVPGTLTPPAGTGTGPVTFTWTATDASAFANINWVYLMFNGEPSGAGACYILYSRTANLVYLMNDAASSQNPGYTPGTAQPVLTNSQCSLNGAAMTVTGAGNTLTLTAPITFNGQWVGAQTVFMAVIDTSGNWAGWTTVGTWTPVSASPQLPTVSSASPASGTGLSQTFTFYSSDVNGSGYIPKQRILFSASSTAPGSEASACEVLYDRARGSLRLLGDDGVTWIGEPGIGASGASLANTQCTIDVAHTAVQDSGNNLAISMPVTFASGFTGQKYVWERVYDHTGQDSGWLSVGAWAVAQRTFHF